MKTWAGVVALVGMMGCGVVNAADVKFDGNELLLECQYFIKLVDGGTVKTDALFDGGTCGGFVQGVSNATSLYSDALSKEDKFCVDDGVTYAQLVRVVVKFLKDNPKQLNKDRTVLVWLALKDAFPCK